METETGGEYGTMEININAYHLILIYILYIYIYILYIKKVQHCP